MSRTECLATGWQRGCAPSLLTTTNPKVQHVFAKIGVPEEQDSFHQRYQAERVTGPCDWFLRTNEYESWRDHPVSTGDKGILWCHGRPGIGKTMLA